MYFKKENHRYKSVTVTGIRGTFFEHDWLRLPGEGNVCQFFNWDDASPFCPWEGSHYVQLTLKKE